MESTDTGIKEITETDEQMLLAQLPEQWQSFCKSGQSVAELAHLVKNIIQMVSGSVEIMELGLERKQYDRVHRSWDIFESNFFRLKKFVLDLIKYTKHYPLQKTECDLNQLIQRVIHSCQDMLKDKHIKIKAVLDKMLPTVQVDADRFEEIVINLLFNAIDNFDGQPGSITIRTHNLTKQHALQLEVDDDGPALPEDIQQQLTVPFERARNMTGTGFEIPLAIAYCRQHNGILRISSEENAGNCTSVFLPVS